MENLLNFFNSNKDAFTSLGIIATFLVGAITLIVTYGNNKNTHYIDTITKNRVDWIYKLRGLIAEFVSVSKLNYSTSIEVFRNDGNYKKMLMLSTEIKLMLNFYGKYDQDIIGLLDEIISDYKKLSGLYFMLEEHGDKLHNHVVDEDVLVDYNFIDYLIECAEKKNLDILDRQEYINDVGNVADLYVKINPNKETNEAFLEHLSTEPEERVRTINSKIDKLIKIMQPYFKSEWNRVKVEASGKKYSTVQQDKEIEKLLNK